MARQAPTIDPGSGSCGTVNPDHSEKKHHQQSKDAHDFAMQRLIQAGVVPVTWQQVLLEWQRDWAHRDSYEAVMHIVREHSGPYGMGADYAYTMGHKAEPRHI